jgi:hypothetical protein
MSQPNLIETLRTATLEALAAATRRRRERPGTTAVTFTDLESIYDEAAKQAAPKLCYPFSDRTCDDPRCDCRGDQQEDRAIAQAAREPQRRPPRRLLALLKSETAENAAAGDGKHATAEGEGIRLHYGNGVTSWFGCTSASGAKNIAALLNQWITAPIPEPSDEGVAGE